MQKLIFYFFMALVAIRTPCHAILSHENFSGDVKKIHLNNLSTAFTLAQTAIWLNQDEFAVGRWDGTITIFRFEDDLSIVQALLLPKRQGVTMLQMVNHSTFVSSNGSSAIAQWEIGEEGYFFERCV